MDEQNNYVFLTGMDSSNSNLANRNLDANVIFLDGTMGTITIDGRKSDFSDPDGVANILTGTPDDATLNRWFTYTVTESGVYTLKPLSPTACWSPTTTRSWTRRREGHQLLQRVGG